MKIFGGGKLDPSSVSQCLHYKWFCKTYGSSAIAADESEICSKWLSSKAMIANVASHRKDLVTLEVAVYTELRSSPLLSLRVYFPYAISPSFAIMKAVTCQCDERAAQKMESCSFFLPLIKSQAPPLHVCSV